MPFITVKYGAGLEKLVNPDCQSIVVLSFIKKACGFSHFFSPIDLATEAGEVLDLNSKPREVAKKYLDDRKCYIPVKVIGEFSEDVCPTFLPLLDLPADSKIKFFIPGTEKKEKKKIDSRNLQLSSLGEMGSQHGVKSTTHRGSIQIENKASKPSALNKLSVTKDKKRGSSTNLKGLKE
ncbi:hypothetical protein HDU98_011647 [Podochytrium sp. JEL0797]|nr:hypothetical protein HDU98_011647 [Podochytrium sp. JEL0797]